MGIKVIQNIFNGGEISPLLYGRYDLPRYQTGSYHVENWIPLPQGGVTRRPGFIYAGKTKNNNCVRLVPFIFNANDCKMLEFGAGYMRVWNSNGSPVLVDGVTYEITLPFEEDEIMELSVIQSSDVLYIASSKRKPSKISRYSNTDWRFEYLDFSPSITAPRSLSVVMGGDEGTSEAKMVYSYVVCAVSAETGEVSEASYSRSITTFPMSSQVYMDVSWSAVAGALEYRVYRLKAGVYGFVGRAIDGARTFRDNNIAPDILDTPKKYDNPFTEDGEYPSLVFFHQQRLGFASSDNKPLTLWLSPNGTFESFAKSVPPLDDDAIEVTMAGRDAGKILWIAPDRDTLLLGCIGAEYSMSATSGSALTPSNINFLLQSSEGSARGLNALATNDGVLFVRRGGDEVFESSYNYSADRYQAMDATILSPHILAGQKVVSWCSQRKPNSLIWLVSHLGNLIGLTYMKEHDVCAWHRHSTQGKFLNVAVIPSPDSDQDILWAIVEREINGIKEKCIELLSPWFDSVEKETAFFVDCGGSYYGEKTKIISGLDHLEGMRVSIFADGAVYPSVIVNDGTITFDNEVKTAHIGLAYTSLLKPVRPEFNVENGTSLTRKRRINSVRFRLYRTVTPGLFAGLDENIFGAQYVGSNHVSMLVEDFPSYTLIGDKKVSLGGGFDENATLYVVTDNPIPATILAVVFVEDIGV